MSERLRDRDRPWESDLERRHVEMLPELEKRVEKHQGWSIAYSTTDEIDSYFLEWGQVYLRRMWSQDLIGLDEKIGGSQFNEYLGILAALSGRAQKHLCYAAILKHRHPELDLRNLAAKPDAKVAMFVLARYEAMFPGVAERDESATWADWNHLLKVFAENPQCSPRQLAELLNAEAARIQASNPDESLAMPLGDLTIILNPASEPEP